MEPAEASGWLKRRSETTEPEAEPKAKGRSFRKEITSEELLTFGKHKGKTFKEALQKDPWYAIWCSDLPEQSLPMRRFLKYAEDQGVVQPSKRPKLEPKPTEAPLDVADAAIFDSFAFAPAVNQPGKHSAFSPHQQLPTSNAVSSPGNIYQQQATPQNSLPNQLQQHAMPQMPQQHPQTNQYQHPSGPQQNQQAVPQMLQQNQSPSQYQYQAARQSGQHVRPPNQQQIQQPSPQQSQRPNQFQQAPAPQMFPRNQSPNQYQHVPAAQFPPQNPPLNQQQAAPQMLEQNQSPSQYQYQAARQSGQNVPPNQQSPQQNQRPNQFQHAPAQFPPQNPPLNQQQTTPQMLQQNQSPSQYQYQAARQSGQHVPPTNQPVRPQMGHVAPPLSSPTTGGLRVTPQEPNASEQARASRHFSPGATPQGLKNAALLEYDGTFEVELGRDKDGGVFTLLSSKKVGKKVFAELKRWPGAKVGPKLDFESRVYLEVVERLRDLYGSRSVKTPPEWVLTMLPDFRKYGALQVPKKVAHVLLADFKAPLLPADACSREGNKVLPYQREAVEFALSRGGRVLLGDEMGLGKTAQALTLASQFPKDFPLLVVCPSSLRGNWLEEASRWLPSSVLPDPEQHVQIVRKGSEKLRMNARVVVVSYDLVAAHETFRRTPAGRPYRMVICDEAHYLKSPSSQRSKALRPVLQGARRCALLTGTPALAKASELYALLQSLLPGLLPDAHNKFCQRYCNEKKIYVGRRQVTQWEGSRLGDELHAILDMVMVRRFKSDVLHQLPAKRRQRVVLEKLSNDQGVLKELKEKMRDFQSHEDGSAPQGSAPELFRLTGLAKMAAVAEYVQYLVEAECRFLLFAHHQAVMDTMQQTLEKMKVGFIRIDGKTSSHRREELVNDFRSKKNLQVALLSITACGQGLNLQVCSTVVFAELHWTPGVLLQAEDRAHRMGQKESVNVHYLIAKDTLDESMYNMLERKQHDVGVMLDGQASRLGAQKVGPKGTFSKPDVEDSADAASGAAEPSGSGTGSDTKGPKQQTLCFKKPQDVIVAPTLEVAPLADATQPTDPIDVD